MKKTHQQLARNANRKAQNQDTTSIEHDELMKQFVAERDHALLSLDEATIRAYTAKWNIRSPEDPDLFWTGIHKARTACTTLPRDARLLSKMWLMARGYHSPDEGDLALKVA